MSLFFVTVILVTFVTITNWYLWLTDFEQDDIGIFKKNLPFALYSVVIITFGKIYHVVAKILVDKENHRT